MTDPTTDLEWLDGDAAAVRWLATIWATVDLERALRDLGAMSDEAAQATAEPLLGARVALVDTTDPETGSALWIALAEPSTEGRLAATLARHGEGPAGSYLAVPLGLAFVAARAAAAGVKVSRPAVGPFGRGLLVLGGPVSGPHQILVEAAAVPSRP